MQHTQFIYFWKTALRGSGGISTHHQEHTQLYLQYLVLVKLFWCSCCQQPHQNRSIQLPHHAQTSSNSSTIAAGSSNGLTITRYCKYACVLLMMGGNTTQNIQSSFPEINKLSNVESCWKYIKRNILTMHGPLNVKKTVYILHKF